MKRNVFFWALATILIVAWPAQSNVNALEKETLLTIADGEWVGTLAAYYVYEVGVAEGFWHWTADMGFASQAGTIDGEFGLAGNGDAKTPEGEATGIVEATGIIAGTSVVPTLQLGDGFTTIISSSGGFTISDTTDIDPSVMGIAPIKLISATCQQVEGQWDDAVVQFLANVDFKTLAVTTHFSAVRVGNLAAEAQSSYHEELTDLTQRANQFLADAKANFLFDEQEFQSLLAQAEKLATSLVANTNCGFVQKGMYALPIAGVVVQLIDFAHKNPGQFTNLQLMHLSMAAVRVGAMGAGAVDPVLANQVREQLAELINSRMDDDANAPDPCPALQTLMVAAGFVSGQLQLKAQDLMSKHGC